MRDKLTMIGIVFVLVASIVVIGNALSTSASSVFSALDQNENFCWEQDLNYDRFRDQCVGQDGYAIDVGRLRAEVMALGSKE